MKRRTAKYPKSRMFKTKPPGQRRTKGVRKDSVTFKSPAELLAYIHRLEGTGRSRTEVILKMLQVARDVAESLGDDWYEIERLAAVEGTSAGSVLAKLARAELHQARKTKS